MILGLDRESDPSQEEIKVAYRRRTLETHPDKVKDKAEEFTKVQEAFETLSDLEKKATYDNTGNFDTNKELLRNSAVEGLLNAFDKFVDELTDEALLNFNVEKTLEEIFVKSEETHEHNILEQKRYIKKLDKMKKRIRKKSKTGKDFITESLDKKIAIKYDNIAESRRKISIIQIMRTLIADFDFPTEANLYLRLGSSVPQEKSEPPRATKNFDSSRGNININWGGF